MKRVMRPSMGWWMAPVLLGVVMCLLGGRADAASAAISFDPATATVNAGETLKTEVLIDVGRASISGYYLELVYDKNAVTIASIGAGESTGFTSSPVYNNSTFTSGRTGVNAAHAEAFGTPTGVVNLFEVTWNVLAGATPASNITISIENAEGSENTLDGDNLDPLTTGTCVITVGGTQQVAVPNVVGQAQAAAEAAITGAGLTLSPVVAQCSDTVAEGNVISQDPAASTMVNPGASVALTISSGPCQVEVPNVVGQAQAAAEAAITGAGLTFTITTQCDNTVAEGNVISQNPTAGTQVNPDSDVTLVISTGSCLTEVPNVVGQTQAAAEAAITGAGFTVGAISEQFSDTVPAGNVISQNPTAGTLAEPGAAVALVVSSGPQMVNVPNVVGMNQAAAEAAITGAGLTVGAVSQQSSPTVPAGSVISQNPGASTNVPLGTAVALVISTGSGLVTVPNVVGMTQEAAAAALAAVGLTPGAITHPCSNLIPEGQVMSQSPASGAQVTAGSAVGMAVSSGPCPQDGYKLSIQREGSGSVQVEPKKPYYMPGDVVTLTASANGDCWAFSEWFQGAQSLGTTNQVQVVMNSNVSVKVVFLRNKPAAATNVVATDGEFEAYVKLTWNEVAGAVAYKVYRGETDNFGDAQPLATIYKQGPAYYDTTAAPAETQGVSCLGNRVITHPYYYWVVTRDMCGNGNPSTPDAGYRGLAVAKAESKGASTAPSTAALGDVLMLVTAAGLLYAASIRREQKA